MYGTHQNHLTFLKRFVWTHKLHHMIFSHTKSNRICSMLNTCINTFFFLLTGSQCATLDTDIQFEFVSSLKPTPLSILIYFFKLNQFFVNFLLNRRTYLKEDIDGSKSRFRVISIRPSYTYLAETLHN